MEIASHVCPGYCNCSSSPSPEAPVAHTPVPFTSTPHASLKPVESMANCKFGENPRAEWMAPQHMAVPFEVIPQVLAKLPAEMEAQLYPDGTTV